ncbi:2OG-Fe(II) oxygenase [Zhouia sp. PK063]|uniref:2OG-Fe(II) oxygenase n=1 Tax=Zhouia sp. PK063 TaxID=3373602 RepID=UPI00379D5113
MLDIIQKIETLDWQQITEAIHKNGYTIVSKFLSAAQCEMLKATYPNDELYRKTVKMERYRFGVGEYKYYNYPLPKIIQSIRSNIYPKLAPIANTWFKALKIDTEFPLVHEDLLKKCYESGQDKATVLILKYSNGGFNTLHQDLFGAIYFPIQIVLMLDESDIDFTGGEFVITKQIPRAQSKAIVLKPKKGDILIFTTNFKPEKGSKGYYRANMKQGVSEITSGNRHSLGIIFHDAIS